ncbi:hypothetical protein A3D09_01375 [Candidatus Collierbacteria bacterium RIFCSPHIGHO2_02_FULL_49_10]|uniref:Nudix hydrolase domain-containing protein n=1 Tax=Candidatus Collierbacteria bacterium RIFCSPHIGHO2_02_FULL_49_10 TaxID=1817723 RepID=A0A1F5EUT5_9BACT|nr:MAG: hypothetical protein A3D09_01375 [Candidatus Collierbacteria bacterium RIFCSPHIGHO2_02_FULL_49_10]
MPHINKQIDFDADVFVVHENKVLLRKHDKFKIWLAVGGHIELDEDPNQAAIREAKEEVGLDIQLVGDVKAYTDPLDGKDLVPPRFLNRHRISDTHEHVSLVFFARALSTKLFQGEKEISEEIRWFSQEELDDPKYGLTERIKYCSKVALEEVKN